MKQQTGRKKSLFLERDFLPPLLALSFLLLVSTSSQIPFGRRRSGWSPSIYFHVRGKALEENSSQGVSASVSYFARRRFDSAKGLRGFTSITEIHREKRTMALCSEAKKSTVRSFWKSGRFSVIRQKHKVSFVFRSSLKMHLHSQSTIYGSIAFNGRTDLNFFIVFLEKKKKFFCKLSERRLETFRFQ